jgi:hypothetical protein
MATNSSSSNSNRRSDNMERVTSQADARRHTTNGRMVGTHEGRVVNASLIGMDGERDLFQTMGDYFANCLRMIGRGELKPHPFRTWDAVHRDFVAYVTDRIGWNFKVHEETKNTPEFQNKVRILTIPKLYATKRHITEAEVQPFNQMNDDDHPLNAYAQSKGWVLTAALFQTTDKKNTTVMALVILVPTKDRAVTDLAPAAAGAAEDPE